MTTAVQRPVCASKKLKPAPALQDAVMALPLIATKVDECVHMHMQFAHAGENVRACVVPVGGKSSFALMMHDGREWTLAVLPFAPADLRKASEKIAGVLPAGSTINAEASLANSVAKAWEKIKGRPARHVLDDTYFTRDKSRLPWVAASLPLVLASSYGLDKAAGEMAGCYADVYGHAPPATEFRQLLSKCEAVLWRGESAVESFQLFTTIAPRHIVIGNAFGNPAHMPYLFAYLVQQPGNVGAVVEGGNKAREVQLRRAGFDVTRRFSTYRLD